VQRKMSCTGRVWHAPVVVLGWHTAEAVVLVRVCLQVGVQMVAAVQGPCGAVQGPTANIPWVRDS
jgi:hypothetical protein